MASNVHFNAGAVLKDRFRKVKREPKPDAKPTKVDAHGNGLEWDEEDMHDVLQGRVAIMSLDSPVRGDQKDLETDPTKWAKKVGQREDLAEEITAALMEGDGWVELSEGDRDLIVDRLAQCALAMTNANIGPVIRALNNAPKQRPDKAKAANGAGAEHHVAA